MKNKWTSLLLIGFFALALTNCKEEDKETCEQDEICTNKNVTTCCDDTTCTWQYNDKTYTEDELGQLATDLGCTAEADLIPSLQALALKVRTANL